MPGPVSDSYDPEYSTGANRQDIIEELRRMYGSVSRGPLAGREPKYIVEVVNQESTDPDVTNGATAEFTLRDWRLIRFAIERALVELGP